MTLEQQTVLLALIGRVLERLEELSRTTPLTTEQCALLVRARIDARLIAAELTHIATVGDGRYSLAQVVDGYMRQSL